ncbi:hypothetical protein LTR17_021829 [Elasticomyces elasticus]|nr:hypothetical protein LTR17_021829 [Elasticomyces elasticus]
MADTSDGPRGTPDGESSSHTGRVMTVATTNNLHQPGFLRIPPELRLEIYELSMPRKTTILVSAETNTSTAFHRRDVSSSIGNDKLSSRFLPRLPPISQHAPLECPRTISGGSREAVKAMTHIKVNFIIITIPYKGENLRIRLSMTRPKTGNVSVENLSVYAPHDRRPIDLCLCGGLGWATESTQPDSSIPERLRDFVAYCETFSAATRTKSNTEESTCEQCRKVRFMQAPEPPPMSDEMRRKLEDIAAKTAEMEKWEKLKWLKASEKLGW